MPEQSETAFLMRELKIQKLFLRINRKCWETITTSTVPSPTILCSPTSTDQGEVSSKTTSRPHQSNQIAKIEDNKTQKYDLKKLKNKQSTRIKFQSFYRQKIIFLGLKSYVQDYLWL